VRFSDTISTCIVFWQILRDMFYPFLVAF